MSLLFRAALFCGLAGLATGTGGCFMAAFALAPVAVQLVRAAGSGVASAARSRKSPGQTDQAQDAETCAMNGQRLPPLIEFKTDKLGTTLYRPLALNGLQIEPRVLAVANQSDSGGWKLAGNFNRMNFKPPLQNALAPRSITYLGYAPAEVRDPAERAQVDALSHTFALDTGTFDWKGRVYRYAVAHQLSCVSPPAHRD